MAAVVSCYSGEDFISLKKKTLQSEADICVTYRLYLLAAQKQVFFLFFFLNLQWLANYEATMEVISTLHSEHFQVKTILLNALNV